MKLESKIKKCILVGYSKETKGYRCYEPSTQKTHISGDVIFQERRFWHTLENTSYHAPSVALEPLNEHSVAIKIFDPILVSYVSQPIDQPAFPTHTNATSSFGSNLESTIVASLPPLPAEPDHLELISSPPLCMYVRRCQMAAQPNHNIPSSSNSLSFEPNLEPPLLRCSARTHIPN